MKTPLPGLLLSLLALTACRTPQSIVEAPAAAAPKAESIEEAMPEAGYSWLRLADLAAANSWEIRSLAGEAEAERLWGFTRAQTRDPRLLGTYDRSHGSSWEKNASEITQPFSRDRRYSHSTETDRDYTVGGRLRIYTSNPFVNRHLRAEGTGRAEELIGKAAAIKHDLTEETLLLCIEIHRLEQEQHLAAEALRLRSEILQHAQRAAEAGVLTFYEVARDELALENLRATNREREMRLASLRRELAALCGLSPETLRIAPPDTDFTLLPEELPAADNLYAEAIAKHPQLAIARSLKKQAQAQAGAARAQQIPWFEYIDGGYARSHAHGTENGWENNRTGDRFERSNSHGNSSDSSWEIRAAITIPIFSWFSSAGKEARLRLQAAEARELALFEHIRREINGLRSDLLAASAAYTQAEEAFSAYEKRLHERLAPLRQNATADREAFLKLELDQIEVKMRLLRLEERCRTVYINLLTTLSRTADMCEAL